MNFNIFKRKAQQQLPVMHGYCRSFAAAEVSRVLGPWQWDGGFSNQEIASALASIRARSREMHKNNGDFKKFIGMFEANVVGACGFMLKCTAVKSIDDPKLDAEASFFTEYHFNRWAKNRMWADVTGRKSFAGICRLAAISWARDGEAFIYIDRNAQNRYGISLRIVRPDACPEWYQGTTDEGNWIRNGIEVQPNSYKPVAYYFDGAKEDDTNPVIHNGKAHHFVRIPASDIVHLYVQYDECQTRGIPLTHAALKKGKMLECYDEAELVAARDEANWLGIFHAPAGREGEIASLDNDTETQGKLQRSSRKAHDIILPQGWDYDPKVPQHPNREVTAFKATMKRDLANALGVEYANFANDWAGVNFSSVRAGTLAERDMWMVLQEGFIEKCCTPIYLAWLDSWLRLSLSGKYTVRDFERMAEHIFRARRWAWVDPMKDINAAVIAVSHHWKTDAQVAAEYGTDYDDNLEEAARVKALREQYGLAEPLTDTPAPSAAGADDDDGKNEDDDKGGENAETDDDKK